MRDCQCVDIEEAESPAATATEAKCHHKGQNPVRVINNGSCDVETFTNLRYKVRKNGSKNYQSKKKKKDLMHLAHFWTVTRGQTNELYHGSYGNRGKRFIPGEQLHCSLISLQTLDTFELLNLLHRWLPLLPVIHHVPCPHLSSLSPLRQF